MPSQPALSGTPPGHMGDGCLSVPCADGINTVGGGWCADVGKKATTMTSAVWLDQVDAATISEGEEVTLMDWGNCIVRSIAKDADGKVTGLTGETHLAGSVKSTKLKLTWLPQIEVRGHVSFLVGFNTLIRRATTWISLTGGVSGRWTAPGSYGADAHRVRPAHHQEEARGGGQLRGLCERRLRAQDAGRGRCQHAHHQAGRGDSD